MADNGGSTQSTNSPFPAFFQPLTSENSSHSDLWRVQHNRSSAKILQNGDLVARDPDTIPQDMTQLYWCVRRRLKQVDDSVAPDCFIPVFSDDASALRWAKAWCQQTGNNAEGLQLLKIDPQLLLSQTMLFSGVTLCEVLEVEVSLDADVYFILNRVPAAAITVHAEGEEGLAEKEAELVAVAEALLEARRLSGHQ